MLKIRYEVDRDNYAPQRLVYLSTKIPNNIDPKLYNYSKEFGELIEYFNKELQEAFNAGREFERSYKPEDD